MTTINLINNTETFTLNGVVYTHHTETGRFSKTENGKTKRIGITEYQVAEDEADRLDAKLDAAMNKLGYSRINSEWNDIRYSTCNGMSKVMAWNTVEEGLAWVEAELDAAAENPEVSLEQFVELVQEAEESVNTEAGKEIAEELAPKAKKVRKPRKSKDIAYTYYTDDEHTNALFTLTAKQVDFIKHLPDTYFWENGVESIIWVDCLCDDIGGQFAGKPMTVGAMISTLCEKGLGTRTTDRKGPRGGKATSFALTEMGMAVAIDLGL